MRVRRLLSLLLIVLFLLSLFPDSSLALDGQDLPLYLSTDRNEDIEIGETLTVTVTIGADNPGFCVGTFYFEASDHLTCVSATCLSEECRFFEAQTGLYEGCTGLIYLETDNFSKTETTFCTMTFRADRAGDYQIKLHPVDLRGLDGAGKLRSIETGDIPALTGCVIMPDNPIIMTDCLPDGMKGLPYSFAVIANVREDVIYRLTDGVLPRGLTLSEDGLIAGTAEETGTFSFTVVAVQYDTLESEAKTITLTVVEKPDVLRLKNHLGLLLEDGILHGIHDQVTARDFFAYFENDSETLVLFDGNGTRVTDPDAYVGTGFELRLIYGSGQVIDQLTVILLGDVDGNGEIGSRDYQMIRAHYLGTRQLTGIYFAAGLVSGDDDIGSRDYQRVRAHYLGNYNIFG